MIQPPPTAIRRWLDAFVALPDRLRFPLAVILALIVHVMVVCVAWLWPLLLMLLVSLSILPESCSHRARTVAPPEKKTLELTIVTPTPAPKDTKPLAPVEQGRLEKMFAELPEEIRREYLDVEGLARKKNMSERALLESWADSVAGSRKPGAGDSPLPTQDGREDLPFTNFKNQEARLGDPKKDPAASPESDPLFKPVPVKPDQINSADPAKVAAVSEPARPKPPAPAPKPASPAETEPPPPNLKQVESPSEDEIPLFVKAEATTATVDKPLALKPTPEPEVKPTPVPLTPTPTPVPTPKPATLPTPPPRSLIVAAKIPQDPSRPLPVKDPGYSPHLAMRKIDGGNAPVGGNGVDAVATTRGRYVKSLNQAVGSRWTFYVRDPRQASLIAVGSVTLKFSMDARGKLVKMKVVDNTSNAAYASLCERAFLEALAEFDKPPAELLRAGVFEDTFTFTLY